MTALLVDRIRSETRRRLAALHRYDADDVRVSAQGDQVLLDGAVDDAFVRSLVEQIATELAGAGRVTNRVHVRDEIGAEASAKETEFKDGQAAPTKTIPRPDA
jgi:osmotically-inducible protein OsmY